MYGENILYLQFVLGYSSHGLLAHQLHSLCREPPRKSSELGNKRPNSSFASHLLRSSRPANAEFLHPRLKSASFQTQDRSRSFAASNHPSRSVENLKDVSALYLFERLHLVRVIGSGRLREVTESHIQDGA